MTTLELLQLQNEHKEDNFFEKGEDKQVMSNEYVIHEDDDFEFEWNYGIDILKEHNAKYEQGLKENKTMSKKGAFDIRETKKALVVNGTAIYEYDGTAIYDLHISASLAYIWKTHMFVGGGVIRSMTVSDIKKFFYENPEFAETGYFNIVQDINHMSDIYLIH